MLQFTKMMLESHSPRMIKSIFSHNNIMLLIWFKKLAFPILLPVFLRAGLRVRPHWNPGVQRIPAGAPGEQGAAAKGRQEGFPEKQQDNPARLAATHKADLEPGQGRRPQDQRRRARQPAFSAAEQSQWQAADSHCTFMRTDFSANFVESFFLAVVLMGTFRFLKV